MNLEKLKDAARKHELKEDWHRAIEVYQKAIQAFESGADPAPDLTIYNRIGDLQLRVNDTNAAVSSYERAAELYAEQGFVNNAIALCGKILRVNPGRIQTYLRLAELHARKNVVGDTKRNLLEFIERMHAQRRLEEAFAAMRSFAGEFAASLEIREMLSELLRAGARSGEVRAHFSKLADELERIGPGGASARKASPAGEDEEDRPAGGGGLVFLDTGVDHPVVGSERPAAATTAAAVPPVEGLQSTDPSGIQVDPLEIETGRADEAALSLETGVTPPLSGLETTAVEVSLDSGEADPPRFEGLLVADSLEAAVEESPPPPGLDLEQAPEDIDLEADVRTDYDRTPVEEVGPLRSTGQAGLVTDQTFETAPAPAPAPPIPALPALVPEPPASIDVLEQRVLDNADSPDAHRALGEALLAAGARDRGREELELALGRYEAREDWVHADDMVTELIRIDPMAVRYYQKRVELSFRRQDRALLLNAYLELADCLVRLGALEKAQAVYSRVLEHEPDNDRARGALEAISPAPAAAPPEPSRAAGPRAGAGGGAAPRGDYVDLGELVLEDIVPRGDTRIRVQDEEPTGDEEADFRQILQQFKQGIERGLDEEDYQSHYDLGIAFKEMGLLDEAIAEFQKALRAPEGRLRTAEALGVCFFEKGQLPVAAAILRRAVDTLGGGDDEKIGLLYWLGRAEEEQGRGVEARLHYERALAVDIGFRDLGERLRRLGEEGRA